MAEKLRIIAHRGVSSEAPENTVAAFVKCLEYGIRWFEFDVQMAADSSVIVMHDDTVDRTTNGTGAVADMSFDQLRRLDAGAWFGAGYRLERIPELATIIELLNRYDLCANLEIKPDFGTSEHRAQFTEALAASVGQLKDHDRLLVSSFQPEMLARFRSVNDKIPRALLIEKQPLATDITGVVELAQELDCQAVNPEDKGLQPGQVQVLREAGLQVNVWTVDDAARARELYEWGVAGVFTNRPRQLLEELGDIAS